MSMTAKKSLKIALSCAFCAMATVATAAEETANLNVSAIVADSCTLTAATALSFATINSSAASNEATPGSVVVLCTGQRTGATVTLGAGDNFGGGTRKMASTSGALLPYSVYSDAGHSSVIANGGSIYTGNFAPAVPQAIAVYGQIPPGSYAAGLYSDTILVTLTH